jgi:hypothetical protein
MPHTLEPQFRGATSMGSIPGCFDAQAAVAHGEKALVDASGCS